MSPYRSQYDSPMAPIFTDAETLASPRWPKVVGGISIVLAGFHVTVIAVSAARWMPPPDAREHRSAVATAILGISLMLVLAGGGLALLARRRLARRLHLIYAWIVLLTAIWVLVLLTGTPLQLPAPQVAAAMLQAVYPLFLVFWFGRPNIRSQVAAWR